ncbi:MAG: hypothetical protein M5R41_08855 [Bacteroidia bacterium]|nr:hypothetical protein [Bacteroidia bacterium]
MKRIRDIVFALLLLTLGSAAQEKAEVALVTSVSGSAALLREEGETPLTLGLRLVEGETVRVGKGAVSLVFFSGELVSLADGEELRLGATPEHSTLQADGNTRGLGASDGLSVPSGGLGGSDNDVWQAQLASVSGIRGDALAVAVSPRLAVSEPLPQFVWFDSDSSARDSERNWTLVLRDENGETILTQPLRGKVGMFNTWQPERMPATFRAVAGKQYSWGVFPAGSSAPPGALEANFVYIDTEGMEHAATQRVRLQTLLHSSTIDQPTFHTLNATVAMDERERLFADAVPHLLALATTEQGRSWSGEQLSRILLRFGGQAAPLAPLAARIQTDLTAR